MGGIVTLDFPQNYYISMLKIKVTKGLCQGVGVVYPNKEAMAMCLKASMSILGTTRGNSVPMGVPEIFW